MFIRKQDGQHCSLATVHSAVMHDDKGWRGIAPGKGRRRRGLVVNYPTSADRYQFPTTSGPVDITRVILDVDQWIERVSVPMNRALSYVREGAGVAEVVEYELAVGSNSHVISFTRDVATGRVSVAMEGGLWQGGHTDLRPDRDRT